jgi:hypothetical protein
VDMQRLIAMQTALLSFSLLGSAVSGAVETASRCPATPCVPLASASQEEVTLSISGSVRSLNPLILDALREGLSRSRTLRQLVVTLETSDVIVYLEEGRCADAVGCTMIASVSQARRILRTKFTLRTPHGATALLIQRTELIIQIAHELQHAVEIARAPEVVNGRTLSELYGRIGHPGRWPSTFESDAAIVIGETVRTELTRPSRITSDRSNK